MSWVFFTLLAALLSSISGIFDKAVLGNEMKDPLLATIVAGFTSFIIFVFASLLVKGFAGFFASWTVIGLCLLAGVMYVMIGMLYYYLLKDQEVTRLLPTLALSSIVVVIMSFFILDETFDKHIYLGIIFLVLGALLMSAKKSTVKLKIGITALATFAIMLLYGLRIIIQKVSVDLSDIWTVLLWFGIGSGIAALTFFIIHHPKVIDKARKGVFHLFAVDSISSLSRLCLIAALATGPASLVAALVPISHLFTFVGASIIAHSHPNFLHEVTNKKIFWQKMTATALIIIGAVIIS
jgi:uncharacterized membrane protein